ncbi:hypothetical protein [Hansschlegelia zhihuaiae]|uniref:Uncharacterized protein n=1 Tax=Hansschlegelia zhihuaiae TaxID=405005 RepID=A0A4Q0MIP8_9HYPH|nr:hypothetical protein [Hansschlegelia zhihuaiae]RXF73541.1 hypothetical protein EK403_10130 [Hansschlegelia zhihuaiae]
METEYIRSQIDSGDNVRIKGALQALSKSYRRGVTVHPNQLIGVVNSVTATAFRPTIDEKVRRWVLNALARVGNEGTCIPAVLHLIKNHPQEPQTIASGIAAVYKLCTRSDPEAALAGISFDPQMRTLAALQHVPASKLNLKDLPLNVERATPDLLKLALLVVGLDRSPDNLLNPRHSDAEMVKALGRHHDPIVSQYSVWAITENDKLRLIHLGFDLKDIESHPDNVRGWLFQLLAIEATDAEPHWEFVSLGMGDPATEARKGLALGLRNTFIDVFEPLVMEWVAKEPDPDVRQHIMDHIVRQAARSPKYERYAIDIFDGEPAGSVLRQSMEASAVQTPIYIKFRQIGAGAPDLFGGDIVMGDKTTNIGNVNAGAVAFDGSTATNQGETKIQVLSQMQVQQIQSELAKLEAALHAATALPEDKKREALSYVTAAKADPSPSNVGKVIEFIGHLGTLAEAGTALAPYAAALGNAIGLG